MIASSPSGKKRPLVADDREPALPEALSNVARIQAMHARGLRLGLGILLASATACSSDGRGGAVRRGVDASVQDAGDVGALDGFVPDVSFGDGGFPDAAQLDANTDGGPIPDTGFDAGFVDTGVDSGVDTGVVDTGVIADTGIVTDGGPAPSCDPSFGPATACGGNPTGSWRYVDACAGVLFDETTPFACATPFASRNNIVSASGTLDLIGNATSGTYARNQVANASADVQIPNACLMGLPCALLPQLLGMVTTAGTVTGNCVAAATTCDCSINVETITNDTGTYSITGSNLTASPSGGTPASFDFCAAPGSLIYRGDANNPANRATYVLAP